MPDRKPISRLLSGAALVAVLGLSLSISAFKEKDLDIHWHLKTGEWILEHRAAPSQDFLSYSCAGREWIDAQWLFQVMAWAYYSARGDAGVTVFTMTMTVAILLLILLAVPELALSVRAGAGLLFLLAINPRIVCRPEYLTCGYMAAMFFCLERVGRGRRRYLWLLPVIQLFWANSEGLWPIGIGIMLVWLMDEALAARKFPGFSWRRPVPAGWLLALAAVVLVNFFQPYGFRGFIFPWTLFKEVALASVAQKKLVADIQPLLGEPTVWPAAVPFLVFAAAAILTPLICGRRMRPFLFLLSLFFAYLALSARRNVSIASVMFFYLALAHLKILSEKWPPRRPGDNFLKATAIATAVVSVILAILFQAQPIRTWDLTEKERGLGFSSRYYPEGPAEFLKTIGYEGNILNNDRVGGYLIWAGWPQWKVFADPRQELCGEKLLEKSYVFENQGFFNDATRPYQVEAIVIDLWEPRLVSFAAHLDQLGNWALVYLDRDRGFAVFLLRAPRWREAISRYEIKRPGNGDGDREASRP